MSQHNARLLYLTARWTGDIGETWAGESSMFGVHIGADSAIPDLSTGTRDLQSFLVNDASTTSTTAHLNKQQGWTGDDSGAVNVTDADQDDLAEAMWAFLNAMYPYVPNSFTVESIRLYALSDTGRTVTAPCIYVPTSTLTGGSTNNLAPQLATVVSTGSATLGRKGRGRWYMGPHAASILEAHGLLSSTYITALSTGAQTFLNALRKNGSGLATAYFPITYHRGTTTGSVINSIRVGDMADTQRRRRAQRKENYTTLALS